MRRFGPWTFLVWFVAACASGSGDGVSLERFAQIEIEPPERAVSLPVGSLAIGEETSYDLLVRNTGEDDLVLSALRLSYAPPDGVSEDAPSFTLVSAPALPRTLGDGETVAFSVRFLHQDRTPREATVRLESNSRDDASLGIVVRSYEGRPVAVTSGDELDFGIVRIGTRGERTLSLLNNGDDTLTFRGFRLEGRGAYSFVDRATSTVWERSLETEEGILFDEPVALQPGRSRELLVTYDSVDAASAEGRLDLLTDDPAIVEALSVRLVANDRVPRLTVDPVSIDFGLVGIGVTQVRSVRLTVGGTASLDVYEIALSEDSSFDFAVEYDGIADLPGLAPSPDAPLFIALNDTVEVPLSFVPDTQRDGPDGEPLPDSGTLIIRSSAYEERVEVPLTGTGIDARCPEPVFTIAEGDEVAPQTTLHLDGEASVAYCGSIDDWDWTVVQPEGSVSAYLPSPSFPTPVLPVNAAGTYRFCLEVRDTCGIESCAPVCTEVVVIPDEVIHVELLWATPGDEDPSDEGPMLGADMDLHFLHPYALLGGQDLDGDGRNDGWFDSTYDCFFDNPQPDWGVFGNQEADDDPGLDRDDTDGGGPENVNLNVPEDLSLLPPEVVAGFDGGASAYHMAVHYWNDHGYGPSFATVRVYLFGELVWEQADVEMRHRELWRVGVIRWPEGRVEPFEAEGGGPVIIEDYNHPGWLVP